MKALPIRFGMISLALIFGILIGSVVTGAAVAFQGHMWAAKNHLGIALNQLNAATPDKAGHRAAAIDLVNKAISEAAAGIAAGAK